MSAVLKAKGDLATVRPFAPAGDVSPTLAREQGESERQRARIAFLEDEVRVRETTISALKAEVERAAKDGRSEGYAAGLADAEDRENERVEVLGRAFEAATMVLREKLESLERLAPLLAQDCIDKILSPSPARCEQLRDLIAVQLAAIEKGALVSIEVAREDFSPAALSALGERLGLGECVFVLRDDLQTGACTMILTLGHIEVGIDQQWGALRTLLGDMAEPEHRP